MSLAAIAATTLAVNTAAGQFGTQFLEGNLDQPLFLTQPNNDSRLFVLQKSGEVRLRSNGTLQTNPYIDLSGIIDARSEGGLLGMAFAPDFATSGEIYFNYTVRSSSSVVGQPTVPALDTVIARITVDPTSNQITSPSPETILRTTQPFLNYNAGWIGFAPGDTTGQHLFVPLGDGGSGNDPGNRAQDTSEFLGKILRLDVSGGDDFATDPNRNYVVPTDNAFAADGDPNTLGEIVAYGLRIPFRDGFDRQTGELYLGDVGQNNREESDVFNPALGTYTAGVVGGANFGWRLREGNIQTPGVGGPVPPDYVGPIFDYQHGSGFLTSGNGSIVGGCVYRGSLLGPRYFGKYFFADSTSSQVFMLDPADPANTVHEITGDLFPTGGPGPFGIVSFGEDADGELYITALGQGDLFMIVPEPTATALLALPAIALLRRRR